MARFMKVQIRVILPTNDELTIDVDDNETFEQFQNKCIQLHGLRLDKEYFNFQDIEIDNDINLSQFINSFNTTDSDDQSEIIVYEMHLQPGVNNPNVDPIPIKSVNTINSNDQNYAIQGPFVNLTTENFTTENNFHFQNQILINSENYNNGKISDDVEQSESNKSYTNYMEIESKLREIHETCEELATDFCRLCAKIISEDDEKVELETIIDQISSYLPIKITNEDNLPKQACVECIDSVKMVTEFTQSVLQAEKVLKLKFLSDPSVKLGKENGNVKFERNDPFGKRKFEEILKCRFCQEEIASIDMSIKHSIEAHFNRNSLYICVLCEMGYTKLELLENHVKTKHEHSVARHFNYKCKSCLKSYASLLNLQKHSCLKAKTPQVSLHCEICNRAFPSKVRLNFHRQFHLKNSRSLFCSECRKSFKDESSYFDHVNFLHDPEQIYVCELCEKTFNLRSTFMNHKKMHLEEKNHKCDCCQKTFLTRQALSEHEITHFTSTSKPYQCHLCDKKLTRMNRLRKHLLTHKSEPAVNDINYCNICKECFENKDFADKHTKEKHENIDCIEILSTDKVFVCEYCDKNYSDTETLNLHRLDHQGLTPYVCTICQAKFTTYSRCTSHKTTHGINNDESKPSSFPVVQHFLCEHCNKSYLHWSYLSLHRKLKHSENNIYKCKDCHFEFTSPWTLSHHRRTKHDDYDNQTDNRPDENLKCEDCGKLFNNVEALQTHQVTQHRVKHWKDFSCQKCGKVFATQVALGIHSRTHNKEYKCTKCSKSFVYLGGLNNHLKLHKEPHTICLYCGRKFQSKSECEQHELLHVKKKLICDVCDKNFDTKNQLLEHSHMHEQRPYECQICGLAFKRAFTLQTHMHRHVKSKHSGSFILMVDMKEETENQQNNIKTSTNLSLTQENAHFDAEKTRVNQDNNKFNENHNVSNDNYIDIGDGNLVKLQGNTITIDGNDYLLINQHENDHQYQMIIDENFSDNQEQNSNVNNADDNNINNTIMLVDNDNQLIINNENHNDNQFILAQNNFTEQSFVIGSHFLNNEQSNL